VASGSLADVRRQPAEQVPERLEVVAAETCAELLLKLMTAFRRRV